MNSDANRNPTEFNTITIADADNYIGRFIEHHFRLTIADPDKFHSILRGDTAVEKSELMIWASLNPTPERVDEFEKIWGGDFPETVVMLSSCDIYGAEEGENINEMASVDESSKFCIAEKKMAEMCERHNSCLTILRLPLLVIGTDMQGILMDIVKQIFRGTYYDIPNTQAFVSIVHASSIGPAISISAGTAGIFNLNDGSTTTVAQLAEALSYRIGHKRPFSIKPGVARFLSKAADFLKIKGYGSRMLKFKTTTLTFSAERFMSTFHFSPVATTEYLTTHVYDENSL